MRSASILLAGALLVSCGGGGGGGGGSAGTVTEFIASYCDFLAPCCKMAGLKGDGQQCRVLLSAFSPPTYNAAAGEACLSQLRAASGKPDFCSSDLGGACDGAFPESSKGTKKPGETCSTDSDCASSTEGKVECQHASVNGAEIRKCQLQVTGKEGDQPCVGTVNKDGTSYVFSGIDGDVPARGYLCRVADGLHCDGQTHACVRFKGVGEACTGFDDCGSSAFCESGKCVARKSVGEACTGGFGIGEECVDSAYCQASSMTCAARAGSGSACTMDDECKSSNCVNGKCEGDVPSNLGLALLCGS